MNIKRFYPKEETGFWCTNPWKFLGQFPLLVAIQNVNCDNHEGRLGSGFGLLSSLQNAHHNSDIQQTILSLVQLLVKTSILFMHKQPSFHRFSFYICRNCFPIQPLLGQELFPQSSIIFHWIISSVQLLADKQLLRYFNSHLSKFFTSIRYLLSQTVFYQSSFQRKEKGKGKRKGRGRLRNRRSMQLHKWKLD